MSVVRWHSASVQPRETGNHMKTTNTSADISAKRAAILATLKTLDTEEQALAVARAKQVTAVIDAFPASLAAILGRPIDLKSAISMIRNHAKGKLRLIIGGAAPAHTTGERQYRQPLSAVEREQLKAVLTARQAVIDAGQKPNKTISEVSKDFKTTDATVNKYKAKWGLTRVAV